MKKFYVIAGAVIIIIAVVIMVFTFIMPKGADVKQFEYLVNPQISEKTDETVIVTEETGDPGELGVKAIGYLFKTYYKQKETDKKGHLPAIKARWPLAFNTPKDQWKGYFAIPVPDSIKELVLPENKDNQKVEIQKWQYGTVAEILHKGGYDKETPTIERLNAYIDSMGYKIIGDHEEEYVKGPGMFSKGNPDKYITIIRYRIEKKK